MSADTQVAPAEMQPAWDRQHGLPMLHTLRCCRLRAETATLEAETHEAFRRSVGAGQRALEREAPVRAQLVACHVGPDAECFYPYEIVKVLASLAGAW